MAGDFGANAMKGGFMKLTELGNIQITATIQASQPDIMNVDIVAEGRAEPLSMTTNKDETTDQFCQRLRSMMRALHNAPLRPKDDSTVAAKLPTFEEQKASVKAKAK